MSKIYVIEGVAPTQKDLATELNDRAKMVKPLEQVNYSIMTEGEMETALLAQRSKTLAEFLQGTPQGDAYAQDFSRKLNQLYNGLHRGSFFRTGAATRTAPASGWLTAEERRFVPGKVQLDALFDGNSGGAVVRGIGEIVQLNCDALYPELTVAILQSQNIPANLHMGLITERNAVRERCKVENLWRKGLNDFWPGSGTTLIYEFLTSNMIPGNLSGQSVIDLGGKAARHADFVDKVQKASKLSRNNLRLWLENGVIALSIKGHKGQSLGPQLPVDYINAFREDGQSKINGFPLALIPVAIGVLAINWNGFKRLWEAITQEQKLKDSIKAHVDDIAMFLNKYASEIANVAGLGDWLPSDLPGGGGSGGNNCNPGFVLQNGVCVPEGNLTPNNNNILLLGGAALVGLALLSKK